MKAKERAFYGGIFVALQVMHTFHLEQAAKELVNSVDIDDLNKIAKVDGGVDSETMIWINNVVF